MDDKQTRAHNTLITNIRKPGAADHDYYATDPRAVDLLLEAELFDSDTPIWEPACGEGHISEALKQYGYKVRSTDLVDRGYPGAETGVDFLELQEPTWQGDIITNPPFNCAGEFVSKALDSVADGRRVAMFLKLTFLEGQKRRELFRRYPPQTVYVSSARLECGKNGKFTGSSAVAYVWIIWRKGYAGPTELRWIN